MPSNKNLLNKEEIARTNSVIQPAYDDDESIHEMFSNIENFVSNVYRDLSMTPPNSGSAASSANNCIETPNTNMRRQSTPATSPVSVINIEAEINRINRVCDSVDQNLRSIGLFIDNSMFNITSEGELNRDMTNPLSPSTSIITLNETSSTLSRTRSNNNVQNNKERRRSEPMRPVTAPIIDLSNSESEIYTTPRQTQANDDDVILVSPDVPLVVDLCTPNDRQESHRYRSPINRKVLRRRRLTVYAGNVGVPTAPAKQASSLDRSVEGRTLFICPVCMESCLQQLPTSTVCGHIFCKQCIEKAIASTRKCPMCNKKISQRQTFRIYI